MKQCDIYQATHVKIDGRLEKIKTKIGVKVGHLAKPSEGGFAVITESGRTVTMWEAESYFAADDGCQFYGHSGVANYQLVPTHGNQCALIVSAHAPCQMEINGETPSAARCPLIHQIRVAATLIEIFAKDLDH